MVNTFMDLNCNNRRAEHLKFVLFLTFTLLFFSCVGLSAFSWLLWDYFFVHMWGKKLRAYKFLHCHLTSLGFLSKADINQVKWILYKQKARMG